MCNCVVEISTKKDSVSTNQQAQIHGKYVLVWPGWTVRLCTDVYVGKTNSQLERGDTTVLNHFNDHLFASVFVVYCLLSKFEAPSAQTVNTTTLWAALKSQMPQDSNQAAVSTARTVMMWLWQWWIKNDVHSNGSRTVSKTHYKSKFIVKKNNFLTVDILICHSRKCAGN